MAFHMSTMHMQRHGLEMGADAMQCNASPAA